mmetsp:Transcript_79173/g.228976  ORF Transcript_79173/g.228976 Transcript_79173/m.228976 type:complete len:257 (+) Transcript_79173:252-1022(+)
MVHRGAVILRRRRRARAARHSHRHPGVREPRRSALEPRGHPRPPGAAGSPWREVLVAMHHADDIGRRGTGAGAQGHVAGRGGSAVRGRRDMRRGARRRSWTARLVGHASGHTLHGRVGDCPCERRQPRASDVVLAALSLLRLRNLRERRCLRLLPPSACCAPRPLGQVAAGEARGHEPRCEERMVVGVGVGQGRALGRCHDRGGALGRARACLRPLAFEPSRPHNLLEATSVLVASLGGPALARVGEHVAEVHRRR